MSVPKSLSELAKTFIYPLYVDENDPRYNPQIMAIFTTFLIPLVLLTVFFLLRTVILDSNLGFSLLLNQQFLVQIIDITIFVLIYTGSRTKYYRISRLIFMCILVFNFFFIAIFPQPLVSTSDFLLSMIDLLAISFIIIIFANFFYSIKTTLILNMILVITLLIYALYTHLPTYITSLDMEVSILFWIAIMSLILANSSLRDKYFRQLDIQNKIVEKERTHFKSLFNDSPISLSLVDLSSLSHYTHVLKITEGVTDFVTYLDENPEIALYSLSLLKIIDINNSTLQLFKAKNQEELFLNLPNIVISSNLHKHVIALIAQSLQVYETEAHLLALNNRPLDIFIKISVVEGFEQSLERVIVAMVDITKRKEAEAALNDLNKILIEKNNLITNIMANIPIITFKTDKNFLIKEIDGYGLSILHKRHEECIDKPLTYVFPLPDNYKTELEQGKKVKFDSNGVINGEQWFCTVHLIPFRVESSKDITTMFEEIIGFSLNVTEEKKVQEQLIESEKFAVLGSMVAGIAHEINNPLAYIKNNTNRLVEYKTNINEIIQELLNLINNNNNNNNDPLSSVGAQTILQKFDWDYINQDFSDILNDNLNGCDLIDKVVNDLRLYGHITENTQDFRAIDINDAIMQAIRISSYKDKDRVDYTINLAPNIRIFGSKTKLIQIFLNLFKNSSQAIIGKGMIKISSNIVNDFLEIKIWDNGQGIDPEVFKKLFKSFITTKREGEGMGLGLTICKAIIEQHGGTIYAQTEPGKYTEFTIYLPLYKAKEETNKS